MRLLVNSQIPLASVEQDAKGTVYRLDGVSDDVFVLTKILTEIRRIKQERR